MEMKCGWKVWTVLMVLLLASPVVGAFSLKLVFPEPPLYAGYSGEYFADGFWVFIRSDYSTHTYFTEVVDASTNRVVLSVDDRLGFVAPVDGGAYLLTTTDGREYSIRLYRRDSNGYKLVWKFDTRKYGWVSYLLPVRDKDLIVAGTVDFSQDNFGGHYILGISFNGVLKFATNLHVFGDVVSNIVPVGEDKYLVVVPGFGGGLPYVGLMDGSGNVLRSIRMKYPTASPYFYFQDHKFIMMSWRTKDEGRIDEMKTYYGIWTVNLTHLATVELPFEFLDAPPIFYNNSLYLFTVEKIGSAKVLMESRYSLNGTLLWKRQVQRLRFSKLSGNCELSMPTKRLVLLSHNNVYVGIFPAGKVVNILAIDFKNAVPLANFTLTSNCNCANGIDFCYVTYDSKRLELGSSGVYSFNFSDIPSAIFIDSSLPSNVSVDNKYRGSTPFYLRVTPGRHAVRIFRRNYEPVEKSVYIGPHEGVRVFADLKPLNATVFINSTPVARVQIVEKGTSVTTPASISLPNGNYTLIVESRDYPAAYEQIVKTITLKPNETLDLNFNLSLVRSKIVIISNVENASVYMDGKLIGKTPFIRFVRLGVHNITITAEGYVSKSLEINATRPLEKLVVNLTPVEKKTEVSNTTSSNTSTEVNTTATPSTISSHELSTTSPENSGSICGPGLVVLLPLLALFLRRKRGV